MNSLPCVVSGSNLLKRCFYPKINSVDLRSLEQELILLPHLSLIVPTFLISFMLAASVSLTFLLSLLLPIQLSNACLVWIPKPVIWPSSGKHVI